MTTEPNHHSTAPARVLGFVDALCVVVGCIVGVGIFLSPSGVAKAVGNGTEALIAWGAAGVIAICGALVFAELGGLFHSAGAQYEIIRTSYGRLLGFLYVVCVTTGIQAGTIAVIASVCTDNLATVLAVPDLHPGWRLGISAMLILSVTAANIVGARWGSRIQNLTVYAKVLALLAVGAVAIFAGEHSVSAGPDSTAPAAANSGGVLGVLAALVPAFFAYGGWQQALWVAGEVREPAKNLPRAIIVGVLIVIAVYVFANWSYLRLLGFDELRASKTIAADAVAVVSPSIGRQLIAGAVALSAFGVLNAQLLTGPRLLFALTRQERISNALATLHPRTGTPVAAIALLALTALGLLLAAGKDGADKLLTGVVCVDSLFFALTGAALFVLRATHPNAPRPFRVPLYPLVPAVFVIGLIGVLVGSLLNRETLHASLIGLGWIVASAVLFAVLNARPRGPNSPRAG